MATSPVEICNSALARVGSERITSLSDDNPRARMLNEQYDKVRKSILRAHPWNFAKRRVELAAITTEPEFGWDYYFQLPDDCLRVLVIDDEEAPWAVEGRYLACDNSTVEILYISDVSDTQQFDPHFDEALAAQIAANISYFLTQSVTLRQDLMREAKELLATARSFNGQEGSPVSVDAGVFRNVRF